MSHNIPAATTATLIAQLDHTARFSDSISTLLRAHHHNTDRLEEQNTYLHERINVMEQTITDVVEEMRNIITYLNEDWEDMESHEVKLDRLLAHTVTLKSLTTPTPTNDNIPF